MRIKAGLLTVLQGRRIPIHFQTSQFPEDAEKGGRPFGLLTAAGNGLKSLSRLGGNWNIFAAGLNEAGVGKGHLKWLASSEREGGQLGGADFSQSLLFSVAF